MTHALRVGVPNLSLDCQHANPCFSTGLDHSPMDDGECCSAHHQEHIYSSRGTIAAMTASLMVIVDLQCPVVGQQAGELLSHAETHWKYYL